ncbi:MAG TPA: type II secretion system protein [Proteobacteria bacterium]|nr:type II secretion system protein [Pseudomonadota bacterium]
MIKKIRKNFKKVNGQKGFTLLEILVVLAIMGFLIAMVAPRLAGISGSAVDTVCDSNQNRMVTYMSSYFEKTNRFPNNLTNLVCEDTATAPLYFIPTVSDQDPANGPETLAKELNDRNHFQIHILDADEAAELKNMGIVQLLNLNSYDNSPILPVNQGPRMKPVIPAVDVGVAMVGVGYDSSGSGWVNVLGERGWGEPDNFGRIVFGMGPECGLITSGVISNAAHCPGGIQNADNVTYNDYILLLPRLEATAARMAGVEPLGTIAAPAALGCAAYDVEPDAPYDYVANANKLKVRTFDITAAQERWQFATMCPEGHMYPADDEEFWGVDLDDDGNIN